MFDNVNAGEAHLHYFLENKLREERLAKGEIRHTSTRPLINGELPAAHKKRRAAKKIQHALNQQAYADSQRPGLRKK